MAEKKSTRPPPRRPSAISAPARKTGAPPRRETLEVDMTWLEGEDSPEKLLIEALKADAAARKRSVPPNRRSTTNIPAVQIPPAGKAPARGRPSEANLRRPSEANARRASNAKVPAAKRAMPPPMTGAAARRETLQVQADWLVEEAPEAQEKPRTSKPPPAKRRAIPPPLPREDKD